MKFREKFEDIDCLQSIIITLICFIVILLMFIHCLWNLYIPQADIVLHDYGRFFDSQDEWLKWRLDHEGK